MLSTQEDRKNILHWHFANEIWKNNTAEIMGHAGTEGKYYDEVVEFAGQIGMIPLKLHKEQPGYILNSLLVPFLNAGEALYANDVADPETIDLTWSLATGAPLAHSVFLILWDWRLHTISFVWIRLQKIRRQHRERLQNA